jgi:multidrug resistance efflux pump
MSDNDLIRRGDLLAEFSDWQVYYKYSCERATNDILAAIRAIAPAASFGDLARVADDWMRQAEVAKADLSRLSALATSMDADFRAATLRAERLRSAVEALGAMPEGYCFCSQNRIGDDSKVHEPECADLRKELNGGENAD